MFPINTLYYIFFPKNYLFARLWMKINALPTEERTAKVRVLSPSLQLLFAVYGWSYFAVWVSGFLAVVFFLLGDTDTLQVLLILLGFFWLITNWGFLVLSHNMPKIISQIGAADTKFDFANKLYEYRLALQVFFDLSTTSSEAVDAAKVAEAKHQELLAYVRQLENGDTTIQSTSNSENVQQSVAGKFRAVQSVTNSKNVQQNIS